MARRRSYVADNALRPGRVGRILGIALQSDGGSTVGRLFIRPMEALDRWLVGIFPRAGEPSLAMHTGIHVELEDGREYVAEQLVGSFYLDFRNALNWTPYDQFTQRDRGGWDVTIPLQHFRAIDESLAAATVERLNQIEGHPFMGEDCTAFVERAFGSRRLFADSPILRRFGIGARIGDPALPLLNPHPPLGHPAHERLRFEAISRLPDALADADSPNVRLWIHRLLPAVLPVVGAALLWRAYPLARRRFSR